jgi:enamine deaminase RidA (YjgF/YER057c/UK114 family)
MNDSKILSRLAELGIELPPPPMPVAAYVPVVVSGSTAYVAGQVPMIEGVLLHPGHLGGEVSTDQGAEAARRAALQALSALREALGTFDRLRRICQVTVFVASASDYLDHPKVANGASELLVSVLGDAGSHARAAVGTTSLPLGSCVEVQVTAEVDPA